MRLRETRRNAALTPVPPGLLAGWTQHHVAKIKTGLINPMLATTATIACAIDADRTNLQRCSEQT
jgi:predicted transcriptional regulator